MKLLYISAKYGLHDYRFLEKLVQDYDVLFLHYSANNLPKEVKTVKNLRTIARKAAIRSFPAATQLLNFRKIVKEFKPDIIHSGYVWQVGILPALINFHPHLSMVWGSDILIEPGKNFLIKSVVRKVMKQADHIQCDAETVKNKIVNDYKVNPDNITVFPWGIDLSMFYRMDKKECRAKLGIDKDKFTFIFSRPLEPLYDIENLMNGFLRFAKDKNDVVLYIAHDGVMKNYVLDFIAKHSLEVKVKMTGWLTYGNVPLWFNASDVFISTSTSDGTPLSLLEAMACGCGLIVTDVPAIIKWVNDENGIVVSQKNSDELKQAFEKYYNNRALIDLHGNKNIQIAKEKADWDKNYLKLKDIYTNLLK